MRATLLFVIAIVLSGRAYAQPEPDKAPPAKPTSVPNPTPEPVAPEPEAEVIQPSSDALDPITCKKPEVFATKQTTPAPLTIPISLVDFDVTGELSDPAPTVRALLAPTMQRHTVLSDELRKQAADAAAAIGYHLVGFGTKDSPTGKHSVLHLAPMPIIRKIDVKIKQSIRDVFDTPLFGDEVKRRMRLRPGGYLPWGPAESACEVEKEQRRIEEYLQGEGYFDAKALVVPKRDGARVTLVIRVELGDEYYVDVGDIKVSPRNLPVDRDAIREAFKRKRCLIFGRVCFRERFTKVSHAAGMQKVIDLFHARQYPGVRVRSTQVKPERVGHTVGFTLTIEPRRRIDVVFEGERTVDDDVLAKQLTFDKAQSADDVEADQSARAIADYLQSRSFFDVRVTWYRVQFPDANFDRLVYRIAQGRGRTVRKVSFVGNLALSSSRKVAEAQLLDSIVTKPIGATAKLLGARSPATSANLTADIERIKGLYKRAGWREARVSVSAATTPAALGSSALTAALLSTDNANNIFVQFAIDAGLPTMLDQIHVELGKDDEIHNEEERTLCREILGDIAELYADPLLATPVNNIRCIATSTKLQYRELEALDTRDRVKERLFSRGRPRTDVDLELKANGPHRVHAIYKVRNTQVLKVGKVVLRGNFRTRNSIILGELAYANFREGDKLTSGALAEATRQLRNTGLFEAINIRLLDIDATTAGSLNTVVEVTERYDYPLGLEASIGYSSFNGVFVSLFPSIKNWFGTGISLDTQATVGFDEEEAIDGNLTFKQLSLEATLRIPQWLSRRWHIPYQPSIEFNGFIRRQDTPRFGVLRTTGLTTTLSRSKSFPRTETSAAHAVTGGFHYDYRRRERNVDVLRPVGADDDESQVPIATITGSVGLFLEWEHRNDRSGQLQPLAPETGFRLEGQVSFAHPYLSLNFGQDTFLKASGVVSKYWPVGSNLVLRVDGRYDQGFPLGGAALLPEVERFFGGGDSTVRGYEDDRLATELVEVAVPPIDNLRQIRVLPAGGNIRALFSADAQLRIYKLLSTAVFFDAGVITNQWTTVTPDDIRPSVGMALMRLVTPFGAFAWERAVPLRPRLGDDPRGRWHVSFAARAQF